MHQEGSPNNPIELLDDDEELRKKEEKIEFERNRQALYQAHMGSQFDVLAAIIKLDIKGTQEQKNRVLKNRILKFFNHGAKSINVESENFRKRRQPDYSNPSTTPTNDTLIIYGVDFLNQKQVKQKFAGLDIELKWLDDSHCQVKFQNSQDARKGLEMNLQNKSQDTVKIQNQDLQIPRGWFEFQPYIYMTLKRRLFGRYAASNENELEIQKSNDYHMYQEAKKKFEQKLKEQVTQARYFEVMKKYKLVNEDRLRQRQTLKRNRDSRDQGFRDRNQYRDRDSEDRFNNYRSRGGRSYGGGNNYYNDRGGGEGQRNRENYRNCRQNQRQRSRDKNRQENNDELDNLSVISRPKSNASRPRKERKFSASICSNQSPVRQNNSVADDDAKSSYSFILNLQEEGNRVLTNFGNLTINDLPEEPNFSKKPMKQEEMNLSLVEDPMEDNRNREINTSLNMLNESVASRRKILNTSIVAEQSMEMKPPKKLNVSIEQIILYD